MLTEIKTDAKKRMDKSIEALETAFARVRTGRAHPSLLDTVFVKYYGSTVPLKQVAHIGVEDGRTLTVKPFEKSTTPDIEKAIMSAGLGLNPSTSGDLIRLPMPSLTEESRKDLIKVVRAEAENARVSIRSVRRDANNDIKELLKEKEISEDEERRGQDDIQKLTDQFIEKITVLLELKEKDLLEI